MKTIKWIVITCLVLGVLLFGIAFAYGATFDDFVGLFNDADRYSEVKTYDFDASADEIVIDVEERYIEFVYSDVEFISVEYREHERDQWTFNLEEGKVTITQKKDFILQFINFSFAPENYKAVKVYLPIGSEYAFDVSTNVGSIKLDFDSNVNVVDLKLESNTGAITINHVTVAGLFDLSSDTGSIEMDQVVGKDLMVRLATGHLQVSHFSFDSIDVDSSTGHFNLSTGAVSEEIKAHLSTGSIHISGVGAASFDLSSSTGSIEIDSDDIDEMYFDLNTSVGTVQVKGINQGNTYVTESSVVHTIFVKVRTNTGSINIH